MTQQKQRNLSMILLVEDNEDDYDATMRSFKKAHFDNPVHWCKTGGDALDYLKHRGKYSSEPYAAMPALILLDLNLPGIDGRKALVFLKNDSDLKHIPVVILTTSADERDIKQCYEIGASTYIQKPVDFEGLIAAVSRIKDYWFGVALLPQG
jgi:CheY-like chemotaxis protein